MAAVIEDEPPPLAEVDARIPRPVVDGRGALPGQGSGSPLSPVRAISRATSSWRCASSRSHVFSLRRGFHRAGTTRAADAVAGRPDADGRCDDADRRRRQRAVDSAPGPRMRRGATGRRPRSAAARRSRPVPSPTCSRRWRGGNPKAEQPAPAAGLPRAAAAGGLVPARRALRSHARGDRSGPRGLPAHDGPGGGVREPLPVLRPGRAHDASRAGQPRARARRGQAAAARIYRSTFEEKELPAAAPRAFELLALDAALTELAAFDPRQARLVELRYFGGLTSAEVAEALGVSATTIKREWSLARAWLYRFLTQRDATKPG